MYTVTEVFAYENIGNDSLALVDYHRAIMLNPEYERPYLNRGNYYVKTKEYHLALRDYKMLKAINPEFHEIDRIIKKIERKIKN